MGAAWEGQPQWTELADAPPRQVIALLSGGAADWAASSGGHGDDTAEGTGPASAHMCLSCHSMLALGPLHQQLRATFYDMRRPYQPGMWGWRGTWQSRGFRSVAPGVTVGPQTGQLSEWR